MVTTAGLVYRLVRTVAKARWEWLADDSGGGGGGLYPIVIP